MIRVPPVLVLAAAVVVLGVLRLPLEIALTSDLRDRGLLLKPLDVSTQAKLGQTSAAVALGGLRTIVAAFQNIRAHAAFQEQDWTRVADTYDTITTLAPRTVSYWQSGGWHMATNAASFYREDSELPAPRRAELRRSFIQRGIGFLKRGADNNPDSWEIPYQLAGIYDDPAKLPDLDAAVAWMDLAVSRPRVPEHVARQHLYLVARHPLRRQQALAMARDLFSHPDGVHRVPNLLAHLYALEHHPDVPPTERHSLAELHPTPALAYQSLCTYWLNRARGAPMDGVRQALTELEQSLGVPPAESIFVKSP
jgi:hypothetical protein